MKIAVGLMILAFLLYNYLVFALVDRFLEKPKLKPLMRIPVGLFNASVAALMMMGSQTTALQSYALVAGLLLLEFCLFYQDKLVRALFMMLAYLLHLMTIRSICVASVALALDRSLFAVVSDPFWLIVTTIATFVCINLAIAVVIKVIPAKGIKIINQNPEQLWFMIAWLAVFCLYLLSNSLVYERSITDPALLINQIAAPLAIMVGVYIILFYAMQTGRLLGYKEENEQLQHLAEKERRYRMSIDKDVLRVVEVNYSKNQIISGFEELAPQLGNMVYDFEQMINYMCQQSVHPDDRALFLCYRSPQELIKAFHEGTQEIHFDFRRLVPEGGYFWMHGFMAFMADEETGDVKGFAQFKNIDKLKRSQEQLHQLAYYDHLTGLPNLTKFKLEAQELLAEQPQKTFVMTKLDIINFKMINDIFGKEVGDMVICKVGVLVEELQQARPQGRAINARIHDDVFIFLEEVGDAPQTECDAHMLAFDTAFQKHLGEHLGGYYVKFRRGRYLLPQGDTNVENAVECVTLAQSKAKESGLSCFDFDIKHKNQMRREAELASRTPQALENEEFLVFLQGKVSLNCDGLCGAESLVRWQTESGALISPAEFIPLFEKNGAVLALDLYMFRQCCAILAGWERQGLARLPISVNFSRRHLTNPNFAVELAAIAAEEGADTQYLEIEITESVVMDASIDLQAIIASLHAHGFKLSIDDFGTGYSSLGMLKNLDIDTIKLDRSFFLDAQENERTRSVLSNMINLAIELGISTVGEGVEEQQHVSLLRELRCDIIQGYYFDRPIYWEEFTQKLKKKTPQGEALPEKTAVF